MIMSYYKCPTKYGDYIFNWNAMNEWRYYMPIPEEGSVPRLLRELGKEGNLKTNYGITGSSTPIEKYYKRTFVTFEYQNPGDFKSCSATDLDYWLKRNKPILAYNSEHAWVIDGLLYDCKRYSNIDGITYGGEGFFFHNIWGWNGNCNGYYKYDGVFNAVRENEDKGIYDNNFVDQNSFIKKYKDIKFCGDFNPR